MFGSAKSVVGLDIGSSCIKAIELKRSKGEIQVSHLGLEPLASDVVVDSMIVDSGHVSTAITKIFGERSIKTRRTRRQHHHRSSPAYSFRHCGRQPGF